MVKNRTPPASTLRNPVLRATKVHFFYVLAYAVFVLEYDAWKLITPEALLDRWSMVTVMLVVTTLCWYAARQKITNSNYYRAILSVIIILDIYVAAFTVFQGRGMASRGVALFAIPIITAALVSRAAIFATAALSVAGYSFAAVRYFALYPSEGYKVELYGDLSFYSASFFIFSALLWIIISKSNLEK